jgi:hypothetical protein
VAERSHHRHTDRDGKCEYNDECNTPKTREHKRVDDVVINKNSLWVRTIVAAVLGAAGGLGSIAMAGWVQTPEKLQLKIDNSPAIIQLKDKVDSLERGLAADRADASNSRTSIDERLFTMNGQLAAVARTVGAEVNVPKQKPLAKPAKAKQPPDPPDKIAAK